MTLSLARFAVSYARDMEYETERFYRRAEFDIARGRWCEAKHSWVKAVVYVLGWLELTPSTSMTSGSGAGSETADDVDDGTTA